VISVRGFRGERVSTLCFFCQFKSDFDETWCEYYEGNGVQLYKANFQYLHKLCLLGQFFPAEQQSYLSRVAMASFYTCYYTLFFLSCSSCSTLVCMYSAFLLTWWLEVCCISIMFCAYDFLGGLCIHFCLASTHILVSDTCIFS